MDNRTTCSICFEPYKGRSPKLLPCFHTFCLPCLVTLRDKARNEATKVEGHIQDDDCCGGDVSNSKYASAGLSIVCPTCRKPNPVPLGGVTQFQTNFYLDGDDASNTAVDTTEDQGPSAVVRTARDQLRVMEAVKAKLAGEKLEVENQMKAVETDIQNRYTLVVNCLTDAENKCSISLKAAGLAVQDKLEAEMMLAENMLSKLSHFLSEQTSQQQPCPTDGESVLLTDAAMRHFRATAEKNVQLTLFSYHPEESLQALKDLLDDFMGRVALFGQAPVLIPKTKMGARDSDRYRGHSTTDAEFLQRCSEISQAESLKLRWELDSLRADNERLRAEFEALQKVAGMETSRLNQEADISQLRAELAALNTIVQTDPSKSKQEADCARLSADLAALQKAVQTDTSQLKQELKQDISSIHRDCTALGVGLVAAEKKMEQIIAENKRLDTNAYGAAKQKVKCTTSVAFHAELDRSMTTKGGRTLYLRDVISNIGGAYNAQSGIFTAPVTGTYIFMATACPTANKESTLNMYHEDKVIAFLWADNHSSSSCHAAVRIAAGERVWLQSPVGDTYSFVGGGNTSFTGILVQEEL